MNESDDPLYRQVLALAGVFQAADLVRHIAWNGVRESDASATLLNSILKIDADTVEDIYGGVDKLRDGLRVLGTQLGSGLSDRNTQVTRYTAHLLALQSKLDKNTQAMQNIYSGIRDTQQQLPNFGIHHTNIIARLADIYTGNVSHVRPQIMVKGDPLHLNNSNTASLIRALLLAGIRSAVLWRQCGGSRFKLLFRRGNYLRCTESIVRGIDAN